MGGVWTIDEARELASDRLTTLPRRWAHAVAAGRLAESLAESSELPERIVIAAWLHDVGYSPSAVATRLHGLDGARFLVTQGAPSEVLPLVAYHTGAQFEAEERGLVQELRVFDPPPVSDLDLLTLVDLAVGPDGGLVIAQDRIAEILRRYADNDPVHRAVSRSGPALLLAATRARRALGLPNDWPVCA